MTEPSTSLPLEFPVRPFPDKDENLEHQTIAIASPISCELSPDADPDGSLSKTSPDCSMPHVSDNQKVHFLETCCEVLPNAGMWGNGWYLELPCLDCPTIESDCLSLPTPTALSSLNSRPPGQNKLEVKLKQLGLIQTGEVANPELLEAMFGLPMGYSSPLEFHPGIAPLAGVEKHSEILLPLSARSQLSDESCTSIPSSDNTVEELLGNTPADTLRERPQRFEEVLDEYGTVQLPSLPSSVLDKREDFFKESTPLEKVLEDETPFSLERTDEQQSLPSTTSYIQVASSPSGSLYRYLKNVKLKSGLSASYPRVDGVRDLDNVNHWYWGYNYKVSEQGEWKSKSLSVPKKKVCTIRLLIESNAPIIAIKNFIKVLEDGQSISRETVLEEKAPHSLEKFSASGSLYRYLKHKKLKSGVIASYPAVESERDPDNPSHWYWGYSYEVLENGKWNSRSLSVPKSKVLAVQGMIDSHKSVCEIKAFIE